MALAAAAKAVTDALFYCNGSAQVPGGVEMDALRVELAKMAEGAS